MEFFPSLKAAPAFAGNAVGRAHQLRMLEKPELQRQSRPHRRQDREG